MPFPFKLINHERKNNQNPGADNVEDASTTGHTIVQWNTGKAWTLILTWKSRFYIKENVQLNNK